MLCFRRDAQGGRSAFRLRIAPDDCVGVPTVILPCGVMAIICLGHPRSCGVAAGVPCTGSWLFKEFLAGSPVAMGGMKGVRCHAHALCYFLYFACGNPCACRGGAEALPMSLRREGRCLAIAIAQLPKGGGIRAYAHFRSSLARWRMKARMGLCPVGVLWPPGAACAPGVRVIGGLG